MYAYIDLIIFEKKFFYFQAVRIILEINEICLSPGIIANFNLFLLFIFLRFWINERIYEFV